MGWLHSHREEQQKKWAQEPLGVLAQGYGRGVPDSLGFGRYFQTALQGITENHAEAAKVPVSRKI